MGQARESIKPHGARSDDERTIKNAGLSPFLNGTIFLTGAEKLGLRWLRSLHDV